LHHDDPASLARMVEVVGAEPELNYRLQILGRANPDLEPRAQVDVTAAVRQIGYRRVHSAAIAVLVVDAMASNAATFDFMDYWRSAAACGALAASMAEAQRSEGRDLVYLSGLLHDAGLWAVDMTSPDELAQLMDAIADEGWSEALEESVLGFTLRDVTAALHRRWHLPIPLSEAHLVRHDPALWSGRPVARTMWQARMALDAIGVTDLVRGASQQATMPLEAQVILERYYDGGSTLIQRAETLVGICLLAREGDFDAGSEAS